MRRCPCAYVDYVNLFLHKITEKWRSKKSRRAVHNYEPSESYFLSTDGLQTHTASRQFYKNLSMLMSISTLNLYSATSWSISSVLAISAVFKPRLKLLLQSDGSRRFISRPNEFQLPSAKREGRRPNVPGPCWNRGKVKKCRLVDLRYMLSTIMLY